MAEILSGGGGTLTEEQKRKMSELYKSYNSDGASTTDVSEGGGTVFKNAVEGGGAGNATGPLADYMSNAGPFENLTSYIPPHLREEDETGGDGEGNSNNDGITDGEDYSDLLTPSGTPMPGHPNYEAWMTAGGASGGGDNPDGMGGQVGDHAGWGDGDGTIGQHSGYTSFKDMFDGGGAGKFGGKHEGMFSSIGNSIAGVLGQDNIANTGGTSYAYNPASNSVSGVAPHPGIQYTAPAAGVLGVDYVDPSNWSSGQVDGTISTDTTDYSSGTSVGGPAGGYSGDYGGAQGDWSGPSFGADGEISGLNQGGHVQYRPQGGSIWDTDRQLEIQMNQLPQGKHDTSGGGGGKGLLGKASGMATGMLMKKVLGGLLGGPLAMLASEGGSVQYKEHGGSIQAPLGPKKTANAMKVESHTKGEARKDMKFAVEEKRKQELHEKKMRVI